jgi:serine/threonine protein kinase
MSTPEAVPTLKPGDVFAGRYRIRSLLGEGHRKVVYLAHDGRMYRDVALALLGRHAWEQDPTAAEQEMRVLGAIGRHDNIVTPYDTGTVGAQHYMVFEYLPGGTLLEHLEQLRSREQRLRGEDVLRLGRQLCRALAHLHGRGIIHRDLCPKNIWLDERLTAHVGDFDTAIFVAEFPPVLRPLTNGSYAAPEESTGDRLDARSDLFSLGAVLFAAAVGPDAIPRDPQLLRARRPDLPTSFAHLVTALLSPSPTDRPADAGIVLTSLLDMRSDLARQRTAQASSSGNLPTPDPAELRLAARVQPIRYSPGDVIGARFDVLEVLGEGGFSQVYRVRDTVEGEERALKLFHNAAGYEAVRRELAALRRIRHPRVVEVYWADKTDTGEWYLVTEFIDGEPLTRYAEGAARLPDREAVGLMVDVLEALVAIHPDIDRIETLKQKGARSDLSDDEFSELQRLKDVGLVHRDIKPGNIMITRTGARLLDFNIASRVGEAVRTQSGTPAYQAPDALLTRWDVSTDLFAVGVVLWQLLCDGQHPYPGSMPMMDASPRDPGQLRPNLPPRLARFLTRACAPDRSDRFQSAAAMRDELLEIRPLL